MFTCKHKSLTKTWKRTVKRGPRAKKVFLWNDRQSGAEKEELGTWSLGVSQPSPVIFCWDSSLTFKAALWQNSRTRDYIFELSLKE